MDAPHSPARPRRRALNGVTALVVGTLVAAGLTTPAGANSDHTPSPVGQILGAGGPTVVPESYIVVLRDSAVGGRAGTRQDAVTRLATEVTSRFGVRPDQVWGDALNGFSIRTSEAVARRIAAHPAVAHVEANQTVQPTSTTLSVPWNLDRLDDPLGLDGSYDYQSQGTGVPVYVIDSGILLTHQEFGGQAYFGYNYGGAAVCGPHGTHLAGTIGGTTYGVAKDATLISVKVLDCGTSSTWAGVISGVNWVTGHHQAGTPAVANLALTGSLNTAANMAVTNMIADGVTTAVAAGNSNLNACNYSPSSVPTAITVGATQQNDTRASFSNYGACLDIFAPGISITSASDTSNIATTAISGTSQASAHVAGMAARVLSNNPTWTPAQVASYLNSGSNPVVGNPGTGTPNRLLHMSPLL
ncbi:Peptidase inhibitor I9 [Micromonospora pallida]|uniref:Peptidase inhibitor I9 n=1 Tax=Micromonospora pallida TaxID=145854 RepID=A0A1C6T3Y0_9ACTN|nr:S8 family peptidase [Micromonospora pallida]SCL36494.1 Peptidase inhibitor I9 [Micromonospora pallida]